MKRKVILAKLNIQGVSITTYYGDKAIEKAEKYLKQYHNFNENMEVYLEVIYQLSQLLKELKIKC